MSVPTPHLSAPDPTLATLPQAQLTPTGNVHVDLTNAAYLIFTGLAVTTTFLAIKYGEKALKSFARVLNSEGTRIAGGIVASLSNDVQRRLRINEYSEDGRKRTVSAMVSDWLRQGKDDATIAAGVRTLGMLEEAVDHPEILNHHFDPRAIAKEAGQDKTPVLRRTLEHAETVIALCQGPQVTPSDRDRLLAAVVLHLPEAGAEIPAEQAEIINSLQAMNASLGHGIRLLAPKEEKADEYRARPGVVALSAAADPVQRIYRIQNQVLMRRRPGSTPSPSVNIHAPGSVFILEQRKDALAKADPIDVGSCHPEDSDLRTATEGARLLSGDSPEAAGPDTSPPR